MYSWALLAIVGFLALALRRGAPSLGAAPGSVEDLARAAAARHDIPPWLILATAQVESNFVTEPRRYDDAGSLSWRPYGIKVVAAADERGGSDAELAAQLDDLVEQTDIVANRLARYWQRYDGNADLVRIAWAWGPGWGNRIWRGESTDRLGSRWPAARRRWHDAIERWRQGNV